MNQTNPDTYLVIKRLKDRYAFDIESVSGFDAALKGIHYEEDEKYEPGGWIFHLESAQRFAIVT